MAAIRLPIDWDGIIPDPGVDFNDWLAVGTVKGVSIIAFDEDIGTSFDLVFEACKDAETGVNLEAVPVASGGNVSLTSMGSGRFTLTNMIRPLGAYFRVHPSTDIFQVVEGFMTSPEAAAKSVWDYTISGSAARAYLLSTSSGGSSNYMSVRGWDFTNQGSVSLEYTEDFDGASYIKLIASPSNGDAEYDLASVASGGDTIIYDDEITAASSLKIEVSADTGAIPTGDLIITVPRLYGSSPITLSIPLVAAGTTQTFSVASTGTLFDTQSGALDVVSTGSGGGGGGALPGAVLFRWYEYEEGHDGEQEYAVEGVLVAAYKNSSGAGDPEQSAYTDSNGLAELWLLPDTYYLFRRKSGRDFTNPETVEVG